MAKASKTFVDWLLPGERGWEESDGWQWKWNGKQMLVREMVGGKLRPWRDSHCFPESVSGTEVFPRPAPRRTVRKVRAWAIVRPDGTVPEVWSDRETALMRQDVGQIVVKLTGEYTPKARKK